jgi:pimeloyl-[acyl-carrier protein] methyl ester esterase
MSLHVQHLGSGPDLVMLHGWGLHGGVFITLAEQLASRFRIWLIDMPGHGRSSPPQQTLDLADLTEIVASVAPSRATWLGWSLGGMVAAQLALTAPARVEKLILVNSSPRFVTADDWPWAMDPAVLASFALALQEDYHDTLERFLSLQIAPGTAEGRHNLRQLREMVLQFPAPAAQALRDGLAILRSADLRTQFSSLRLPTFFILGERDRLVPAAVGPAMHDLLTMARIEVIKGAGHVPFLSHQHQFLTAVSAFLEDHHD